MLSARSSENVVGKLPDIDSKSAPRSSKSSRQNSRQGSRPGSRPDSKAGPWDQLVVLDNQGQGPQDHLEEALPQLDGNSSVSWGHGESKELGATENGTKRKTAKPRETPDEKFDKLVGFIKASKQAKGAIPIGDVVDQWCKISRF